MQSWSICKNLAVFTLVIVTNCIAELRMTLLSGQRLMKLSPSTMNTSRQRAATVTRPVMRRKARRQKRTLNCSLSSVHT
jgi:hypothetical protein